MDSSDEVAPVAVLPFVVSFDQHAAGEPQQGGGVGEDPDDVGAALDLAVEPLEGVGRPDLVPVRVREVREGGEVGLGVAEQLRDGGELRRRACRRRGRPAPGTSAWPGWAKIVRMVAATISAWPLLTLASTLRMKCTRHRCQAPPCSTVPIALTRPRWASLMTSCTPVRPRSRRSRRNSVQNDLGLAVPDRATEHFTSAIGTDAGGDDDGLGHDPPADPDLAVGRVQEHDTGTRCSSSGRVRQVATSVSSCAQIRADLALADPGAAHRDDQVIDPAGADTPST